jgi:hypothetical protein
MSKLQGLQSPAAVVGFNKKPSNINAVQLSRSDKVQSDCSDGAKGLAPSRDSARRTAPVPSDFCFESGSPS